jgi:RHS repeat-associated protein
MPTPAIVATNDSSGAKLSSFSYDYTKNGVDTALRQSVTDLSGTTTYSYDKLNRLTKATGPSMARAYDYDENFNRTSKTEDGTTTSYDYNDANELTKGGSTTYSYDADGNLTGSSSGWSLSHNAVNSQTTTITAPGKAEHQPLQYGGADQTERRRAGSVVYGTSALGVSSATSLQSLNFPNGAAPDDMEPAPGTSSFYTRDNSGNLISLVANGSRYYYLVDGLGSVVGLVNGSAQKVNSYSYDPYGLPLLVSQQVANPWRYAAGFYDGPTGLTKFGARYYDPGLGRFSQRDPSGKDLPYAYASANPVNNTDPTGLATDSEANDAFGIIGGAIAAAAVGALAAELGAPVLLAWGLAGCAAGVAGTLISQQGKSTLSGVALNCGAGFVGGLIGGVFARGASKLFGG